jgi:SAM-dependent methyltransferase
MRAVWHPVSTLLVPGLGCYAGAHLIRMLLAGGEQPELLYGGDRMWPAIRHGQLVRISPIEADEAKRGMVLVVLAGSVPDLLRVDSIASSGKLQLRGDADPDELTEAGADSILGRAHIAERNPGRRLRLLRRLRLDLAEAISGAPDDSGAGDPASTIMHKYENQAPYYAGSPADMLSHSLLGRVNSSIPQEGRVLVVGSGAGHECFALRGAGYEVRGVDFSPAMIATARREAEKRDLDILFEQADIRNHQEAAASLAGIFFTYDVYSFLPGARSRIDLLRRMCGWLAPGGAIFLSARLARRPYERLLLTLQWLRRSGIRPSLWGASHTRYIGPDGAFHRSFVHCFTLKRLRREIAAARLSASAFLEGHIELSAPPTRG